MVAEIISGVTGIATGVATGFLAVKKIQEQGKIDVEKQKAETEHLRVKSDAEIAKMKAAGEIDIAKAEQAYKLKGLEVDIEEKKSILEHDKPEGTVPTWVTVVRAMQRPVWVYLLLLLYLIYKALMTVVTIPLVKTIADIQKIATVLMTPTDFCILLAIVGFLFGSRQVQKYMGVK